VFALWCTGTLALASSIRPLPGAWTDGGRTRGRFHASEGVTLFVTLFFANINRKLGRKTSRNACFEPNICNFAVLGQKRFRAALVCFGPFGP
jgi:hypothetical protein